MSKYPDFSDQKLDYLDFQTATCFIVDISWPFLFEYSCFYYNFPRESIANNCCGVPM